MLDRSCPFTSSPSLLVLRVYPFHTARLYCTFLYYPTTPRPVVLSQFSPLSSFFFFFFFGCRLLLFFSHIFLSRKHTLQGPSRRIQLPVMGVE